MNRKKNFLVYYDKNTDKMTLKMLLKGKDRIISRKNIYLDCPCWTEYFDQGHPRVAMCGYSEGFDIETNNVTIK